MLYILIGATPFILIFAGSFVWVRSRHSFRKFSYELEEAAVLFFKTLAWLVCVGSCLLIAGLIFYVIGAGIVELLS